MTRRELRKRHFEEYATLQNLVVEELQNNNNKMLKEELKKNIEQLTYYQNCLIRPTLYLWRNLKEISNVKVGRKYIYLEEN